MNIKALAVCVLAIAILATPLRVAAQTERGTITGVVMDSTKAALPGVSIRVIHTGTNSAANVVSSDSGNV